jgi:hypothetical protein
MNPNMEIYKTFVEVFRGYLDTALTANIWFYALTGAIVSYYLSNQKKAPYLTYSLFLPFILGVLIIIISVAGIRQAHRIEEMMLKDAGNIQLEHVPAVEVLVSFLKSSVGLISLVCICLALILVFADSSLSEAQLKKKIRKKKWLWVVLITLVGSYYFWVYGWLIG